MKTSVLNLLRGGVFVLAVVAAFAFTTPTEFGVLKGHLGNDVWEVIHEEVKYDCDPAAEVCTALFDENDQLIPGSETPGVYIRL